MSSIMWLLAPVQGVARWLWDWLKQGTRFGFRHALWLSVPAVGSGTRSRIWCNNYQFYSSSVSWIFNGGWTTQMVAVPVQKHWLTEHLQALFYQTLLLQSAAWLEVHAAGKRGTIPTRRSPWRWAAHHLNCCLAHSPHLESGCTMHNAMIIMYPHNRDWDKIAAMFGDESWNSDNMRKYFEVVPQGLSCYLWHAETWKEWIQKQIIVLRNKTRLWWLAEHHSSWCKTCGYWFWPRQSSSITHSRG